MVILIIFLLIRDFMRRSLDLQPKDRVVNVAHSIGIVFVKLFCSLEFHSQCNKMTEQSASESC